MIKPRKLLKSVAALLLAPVCVGAGWALWEVVRASTATPDARDNGVESLCVAALAGAGCWVAVYLLLPKPMWLYVMGHELTHAVWTWLFGGRVKKFKASAKGGHVVVTRSNFVIALAPYFFPFYAMLVALVFVGGNALWNWRPYVVWFHLLLGAAYAFHVTLTCHILKNNQSDITDQGYLFSFVVIFLGNVSVLLAGISLLAAQVSLWTALQWWWRDTAHFVKMLLALRA